MFNNYAFQNHHSLKSDYDAMATAGPQPRQVIVQSSPTGGFHDSTSPNTMMTICLTPFCIAFVLFAIHFVKYSICLNRGVKRLEQVAILERAFCKTPDECS